MHPETSQVCFECHNGIFVDIPNPHSYDYSPWTGRPEKPCNNCGVCRDVEEIISKINIVKTRFSNRFIESVLKCLCDRQRIFSYKIEKILEEKLKDRNINDPYNLAELILFETKELGVTLVWEHVINIIYSKNGAYVNLNSFT